MDGIIEDKAPYSLNEEPEAAESLDRMIARHKRELARAYARAEYAASVEAETLQASVRRDAGAVLAMAMDEVRQALAAARDAGSLHAVLVKAAPPGGLGPALEEATKAAEPGARPVVLMIPERTSTNMQPREAWALVDVSDTVWR